MMLDELCFFVLLSYRGTSGATRPRGWTEEQEFELRNLFDQCRDADGELYISNCAQTLKSNANASA